ncbi:MAG: DnaD domain protein [Bacilli bacterium]|nr:DnaD domain protein [Bacilli bacterium]
MNSIAKLIKAKTIDFTQVLIKHYKAIGLNEATAVIVAKLYYLADENDNFLELEKLAKEVTINIEELSDLVIDLVNKGYIELTLDNNGKETFTLDGVIEKLGVVLDKGSSDELLDERKEKLSLIVSYVETTFSRICSAADLIIINAWLDNNYDYEDIKSAVFRAFQLGKYNLKYADAILASKASHQAKPEIEVDEELKALLDGAYVKK